MKKVWISLVVLALWSVIGYFNYGYTLGYFTNRFPDGQHQNISLAMAIGGPFAAPAVYLVNKNSTKHWLTTPYTKEQRWSEFHRLYPSLSREYFEAGDK